MYGGWLRVWGGVVNKKGRVGELKSMEDNEGKVQSMWRIGFRESECMEGG